MNNLCFSILYVFIQNYTFLYVFTIPHDALVSAIYEHFGFNNQGIKSHRGNPIGVIKKNGKVYELEQYPPRQGNHHRVLITTSVGGEIMKSSEFSVGLDMYMLYWIRIRIPEEI